MDCPICFATIAANEVAWREHNTSVHQGHYAHYVGCKACKIVHKLQLPVVLCPACDVVFYTGVDVETHYMRSLLHPLPCGACGTAFACLKDYDQHFERCPSLQAQHYHGHNTHQEEQLIHNWEPGSDYVPLSFDTSPLHKVPEYHWYLERADRLNTSPGEIDGNAGVATISASEVFVDNDAGPGPSLPTSTSNVRYAPEVNQSRNLSIVVGIPGETGSSFSFKEVNMGTSGGSASSSCSDGSGSSNMYDQEYQEADDDSPGGNRAQTAHAATGTCVALECRICRLTPTQPVATPCGHVFCHNCIAMELTSGTRCPVCYQVVFHELAVN